MGIFEYISGPIREITPASVTIDQNGLGYLIQISVQTYAQLNGKSHGHLWIEEIIREDSHSLYGFASGEEREVFRLLIGVSGIGANTARMMLSSLTTGEIKQAIQSENAPLLKQIKGIGLKTAQRVIIDLKDKMVRTSETHHFLQEANNTARDEALSALVMLGFTKSESARSIDQILGDQPDTGAEELVKLALKKM